MHQYVGDFLLISTLLFKVSLLAGAEISRFSAHFWSKQKEFPKVCKVLSTYCALCRIGKLVILLVILKNDKQYFAVFTEIQIRSEIAGRSSTEKRAATLVHESWLCSQQALASRAYTNLWMPKTLEGRCSALGPACPSYFWHTRPQR